MLDVLILVTTTEKPVIYLVNPMPNKHTKRGVRKYDSEQLFTPENSVIGFSEKKVVISLKKGIEEIKIYQNGGTFELSLPLKTNKKKV